MFVFVFGELCDATLNQQIGHAERLVMAWRAMFFIEVWREFLASAKYDEKKHFLSRECLDIIRMNVNGLTSLILIYRDLVKTEPLLTWMHSSESTEHLFAEIRKYCPNFNLLEMLFLVGKLFKQMQSPAVDTSKETASGYNFTYLTPASKLDLPVLSSFPSDDEIANSLRTAFNQAHYLWQTYFGFIPKARAPAVSSPSVIPPLSSLLQPRGISTVPDRQQRHISNQQTRGNGGNSDSKSESESESDSDSDVDSDLGSDPESEDNSDNENGENDNEDEDDEKSEGKKDIVINPITVPADTLSTPKTHAVDQRSGSVSKPQSKYNFRVILAASTRLDHSFSLLRDRSTLSPMAINAVFAHAGLEMERMAQM